MVTLGEAKPDQTASAVEASQGDRRHGGAARRRKGRRGGPRYQQSGVLEVSPRR